MARSRSEIPAQQQAMGLRRTSRLAMVLLCATAPLSLAMAQYDPGATLDLGMGYGQNALSQSAMRNTSENLRDSERRKDDYAGSGKSRDAHLAELREEYARRVAADGAASANAWASEMGRRDARAERD